MHDNLVRLQELTLKLQEKDEQLKDTRDTYKSLVELLPVIVVVHVNNKIKFINEYALMAFGFKSKEEILGRDINEFIYKDDIPKVRLMLRHLNSRCKQEDFIEVRLIKNDGDIVVSEIGASKIKWNGKEAIQTVIRDITKKKSIENAVLKYYKKAGKLNSQLLDKIKRD